MDSNQFSDLGDNNSKLLGEVSDTLSKAIISILKQQAVQEFFSSNEITCPHCDQHIAAKQLLQNSEKTAAEDTATPTSSNTTTPVDSDDLAEAKELLKKVNSWSDEEIEQLPPAARKKVRQYQGTDSKLDSIC